MVLGLRVDNNEGWFPEQQLASGGTQPEIRNVVSQTDVSPRVGVAIAVGELGQGVIRASYSRYVDALITQNFSFVNDNAISGQVRADCSGPLFFLCGPGDGKEVGYGDGFAVLAEPNDPRYIYATREAGVIVRSDLQTGERKSIVPAHPGSTGTKQPSMAGLNRAINAGSTFCGAQESGV